MSYPVFDHAIVEARQLDLVRDAEHSRLVKVARDGRDPRSKWLLARLREILPLGRARLARRDARTAAQVLSVAAIPTRAKQLATTRRDRVSFCTANRTSEC